MTMFNIYLLTVGRSQLCSAHLLSLLLLNNIRNNNTPLLSDIITCNPDHIHWLVDTDLLWLRHSDCGWLYLL